MLVAMVASAIAVTSTPAQAAPPTAFTVDDPSPGSLSFKDGGAGQSVSLSLHNNGTPASAGVTVSFDPGDAGAAFTVSVVSGCSGSASGCTFNFPDQPANATVTVVFKVTPKSGIVPLGGATKTYSGSFTASAGPDSIDKPINLSIASQQLYSISGTVKDAQTGQPVKGALVNLQDSANHSFTATTGATGKYTFASSASKPIQTGMVTVGAVKDGYEVKSLSPRQFGSGNITNWNIALTPKVVASPSATPSITPSDTSPSDAAATDTASASTDSSTDTGGGTLGGTKSDSGGSSLLTIVLVAGVLLMLGGGGAIAFMFYRRRNNGGGNDDDYDDDPRVPGGGMGGGLHPSSGGPYRNAADPTALVRSPMAEAPTMMHRPAPSPRRPYDQGPGYSGYDGQPTYADPHPSARPPSPRPAADPYQGYPQQPAYAAEPTGYMAPPADRGRGGHPPANGYDQGYGPQGHPGGPAPTQTYQQTQGGYGYGDQNGAGYDQGYGSSGGYGGNTQPAPGGYNSGYADQNGAGYDQGYGSSGGYGGNTQPAPGGYNSGYADQNGASYDQGYDQGGYGSSGGYGGNTQPAPGGYGSQPGGYGAEQGGYGAPQGGQGYGSGYADQNPGGYDQGGYDQGGYGGAGGSGGYGGAGNGYQGNGYDQQGYQGNGYGHEQPPARGGHPQAPQSGGGYRGGYTPPEERNVDWLDD
jgi:hypothetical protein